MKIIVNNVVKDYPKRCVCINCKSIIEIDEKDVKTLTFEDYDSRERELFKYKDNGFKCPCCHKPTIIQTI